jgi:hypothetical protein
MEEIETREMEKPVATEQDLFAAVQAVIRELNVVEFGCTPHEFMR